MTYEYKLNLLIEKKLLNLKKRIFSFKVLIILIFQN